MRIIEFILPNFSMNPLLLRNYSKDTEAPRNESLIIHPKLTIEALRQTATKSHTGLPLVEIITTVTGTGTGTGTTKEKGIGSTSIGTGNVIAIGRIHLVGTPHTPTRTGTADTPLLRVVTQMITTDLVVMGAHATGNKTIPTEPTIVVMDILAATKPPAGMIMMMRKIRKGVRNEEADARARIVSGGTIIK